MSTTTTTTTDAYSHIYIDPTSGTNGAGTIGDPKNTFTGLTLQDNTKYHIKRGTTLTSSTVIDLSSRTNTIITDYDSGDIPAFKWTGTGTCAVRFAQSTSCTVENLEVYTDLSNSVITLIQLGTGTQFNGGTGNTIQNCLLHDVKQGTSDGGIGIRGGGDELSILYTEIYNCGCDGIYLANANDLEIGWCNIHHINQNYAGSGVGFNSLGTGAGGDNIQLDGSWDGFYIHDTILDRTDAYTGNKFALIYNSGTGVNESSSGIIEHCDFKMKSGSNLGAAIYAGWGDGTIIRFNIFRIGGIRISNYTGQTMTCANTLIHHNLFIGCAYAAGVAYGGATPDTRNTKFYNNTVYEGTNASWLDRTYIDMRNNIFDRGSTSSVAIYNYGGSSWTIYNNCYSESAAAGTPGTGTDPQIGDPGFIDEDEEDFHLSSGSICRDNGVDLSFTEDFDGLSVPQETYPSIGAYEYAFWLTKSLKKYDSGMWTSFPLKVYSGGSWIEKPLKVYVP